MYWYCILTYSMVPSPSWEANWLAASQEIPRISRNPKVHYRTHKPCHLSLSWASPIQSIYPHPTSWRSILILSTHLRLGLSSGLLPDLHHIRYSMRNEVTLLMRWIRQWWTRNVVIFAEKNLGPTAKFPYLSNFLFLPQEPVAVVGTMALVCRFRFDWQCSLVWALRYGILKKG